MEEKLSMLKYQVFKNFGIVRLFDDYYSITKNGIQAAFSWRWWSTEAEAALKRIFFNFGLRINSIKYHDNYGIKKNYVTIYHMEFIK